MPTFIDLFSGCGGFTLGMQRAGFDCLAAVDFEASELGRESGRPGYRVHPQIERGIELGMPQKRRTVFIHPVPNRSLTPREAARVQSFPDWFVFPEARTHSFRLIGNAVPPLIAEAVGLAGKTEFSLRQ